MLLCLPNNLTVRLLTSCEGSETIEDERGPGQEDRGDPTLSVLVRIANAGGMSLGVTLMVGGAVVSGILVGTADFNEGLAEYIDQKSGPDGKFLADMHRKAAEDLRSEFGDDFKAAFGAPYVATYIHLRDARVYTPHGSVPRNEGIFWRGRLDSVDGWSIGSLGT